MEELNKFSKANPFKVPDGYFDNFQEHLKDKLEQKQIKIDKKRYVVGIKPILAIAASLLLIFSLRFLFVDNAAKKTHEMSQDKTEQLPELKYFESVGSGELIELVSSAENTQPGLNVNIDQDYDILIDRFEESTIIDQI